MQTGKSFGQALVVAGQPPTACYPGETSLDDLAAREEDEAKLDAFRRPLRAGFGQLDHLQSDVVRGGSLGRALACVALVDVSQSDAAGSCLSHAYLTVIRQAAAGGFAVPYLPELRRLLWSLVWTRPPGPPQICGIVNVAPPPEARQTTPVEAADENPSNLTVVLGPST